MGGNSAQATGRRCPSRFVHWYIILGSHPWRSVQGELFCYSSKHMLRGGSQRPMYTFSKYLNDDKFLPKNPNFYILLKIRSGKWQGVQRWNKFSENDVNMDDLLCHCTNSTRQSSPVYKSQERVTSLIRYKIIQKIAVDN